MPDETDPSGVTRRSRLGVYGLALDGSRILLSRISAMVPEGEGRWTLPGGGMDWGETAEETLRREMWEETGLLPEIGPLMYVHSFGFERPGVHYHSMRAVYRVDVRGEPTVTEIGGSVDLAAWHQLDRLDEIPLVRLVTEALDRL